MPLPPYPANNRKFCAGEIQITVTYHHSPQQLEGGGTFQLQPPSVILEQYVLPIFEGRGLLSPGTFWWTLHRTGKEADRAAIILVLRVVLAPDVHLQYTMLYTYQVWHVCEPRVLLKDLIHCWWLCSDPPSPVGVGFLHTLFYSWDILWSWSQLFGGRYVLCDDLFSHGRIHCSSNCRRTNCRTTTGPPPLGIAPLVLLKCSP